MIDIKTGIYEWKKILFYRKGVWVIFLYILLRLFSLIFYDRPVNQDIFNYSEGYKYYLKMAAGKVDESKNHLFEEISDEFSEYDSKLQTIYDDCSNGKTDKKEYESLLGSIDIKLKRKAGFQALYNQYIYARENTENRYLLDTNAWDALLSKDSINILMVIVIMVLSLITFGTEITCEMDTIIRITKNGEQRTAWEKLAAAGILSIGICMLDFVLECLYLQFKYGFSHGDYPIQSLSYFGEYIGECSLNHAVVVVLLFRLTGCLFWAVFVCAVIVCVRRYSLAMAISFTAILLPYYGLPNSYMKYYIPFPLGLIVGTGYLRGSIFSYDEYTGKEMAEFVQIKDNICYAVVFTSIVLMLVLSLYVIRKYANCWKRFRLKKLLGVCMLVMCVSFMAACNKGDAEEYGFYNFSERYNYENDDYLVYTGYTDIESPDIIYENKETGEKGSLVRDAFAEGKEVFPFFYGNKEYIYYMELSYDYAERGMSKKYDEFFVKCVDLNDFSCRTIFRDNADFNPTGTLGLRKIKDNNADLYQGIAGFFVKDKIIFVVASDGVWRIDIANGRQKLLFLYNGGYLSFDGEDIYYLDEMSRLTKYNIKSGHEDKSLNITASKFEITDNYIIYTDRISSEALKIRDMDSGVILAEEKEDIFDFLTDGNYVYYVKTSDSQLCKINLLSGDKKEIGNSGYSMIYPFRNSPKMYVADSEDGSMDIIWK